MFAALGTIFGSKKVIDAGIAAIDAMVFTDEEKSRAKIVLLKAYEPFKIAQRYLAFMFCGQFLLTFNICLGLLLSGKKEMIKDVLELVAVFSLGEIVLAIVAFYFLGGVVNGFGKKK